MVQRPVPVPSTWPASRPIDTRPAFGWLPGGVFTVTALLMAALFLVAPGGFALKAHLALHGLCAQTPGHTLAIGSQPLPFDARMTGIYAGFAVATLWLVGRRRLAAAGLPPWPVGAALLAFVAAMGVDGTNSLLLDLGLPHLYTPDNLLRLATGTLAGLALAAVLVYLMAGTLWRTPREHEAAVGGWRDLAELLGLGAAVDGAIVSVSAMGPGWLYGPVAALLLLSAVAVVATLALVGLVIARRQEGRFRAFAELRRPAALALVLGGLAMAALSGGRLLLEAGAGLPLPAH